MSAQLTLTKANNAPIVGYMKANTSYDSTVAIPKTIGTNKNWNFTSLAILSGTSSSTYVNSSTTPSVGLFPAANIAQDDGSGYYEYFNSQTSTLDDLGSADVTNGTSTIFSNPAKWMVWPFGYGTSSNDAFAATASFDPTTTVNYTGNMVVTGTGAGTVILPNGNKYTNCLQITRTYTIVGTGAFTGTFTLRDYEYWASTYRSPLINVSYQTTKDINGTTKDFNITVNSLADVGLEEQEILLHNVKVFPNPAKDIINVELEENVIADKIELYDIKGKLVLAQELNNKINISDLDPGIYLLNVRSNDAYFRKRISVIK